MGKPLVAKGWPPRWLTPVPQADLKRGDGDIAVDFLESFCRVTKDSIAAPTGELLLLRDWQKELIRHLLARRADGKLRHRQGLVLMPRKNGKSALLSSLTLYLTFCGAKGGESYAVASSKDQARIVFNDAKKMIQMDAELSKSVKLYRDAIEVVDSGSIMRVLAAEAPQLEGLNPTAVCYDEVHTAPNRQLWDVLALATASRIEPLMVGISTAGVKTDTEGKDSLCYSMYQYGQRVANGEIEDQSFFFAGWEPSTLDAAYDSPVTWQEANPGYGDLQDPEDFISSIKKTPEAEFKTKRLNIWTSVSETWLPNGAWDAIGNPVEIPNGADIVIGFDGSFNGDCTAIVAVSVEETHHIMPIKVWEKPDEADANWQVPVLEVEDAIREAAKRWQVLEISCDPYRWARTFQVLEDENLPVVTFPQNASRMTPATTRLFEAVVNKSITHNGDPQLARHISNATLRVDARGTRLAKEKRGSQRRIDLAVASVMALERAAWWQTQSGNLPQVFDPWSLQEEEVPSVWSNHNNS